MLYAGGLLGAVLLLVWLFCIIDVIMTPAEDCRYLPKLLWLGLVILLGDFGSVLWLLVGRPWPAGSPVERLFGRGAGSTAGGSRVRFPEYDRPGRFAASSPEDDEAFLAQVRERAQAQRSSEAARRRERERTETAERDQHRETRAARDTAAAPPPVSDPDGADALDGENDTDTDGGRDDLGDSR